MRRRRRRRTAADQSSGPEAISPKSAGLALKGADKCADRAFNDDFDLTIAGLGCEAKQLAQLDIGAHEADELLGGEPRVGQRQCAGRRRTAQKTLDLDTFALGSGTPKHLAEHREAGNLAQDDAVQRDRVGRQDELEKTAPRY